MTKTDSRRSSPSRSNKRGPKPRHVAARQSARKTATRKPQLQTDPRRPAAKPRSDSKQERIIALLRTSDGATIAAMAGAAGWQQHSVRGFLAGVVRKKLGLSLVSEAHDNGRIYRIKDSRARSVAAGTA